ncbi:hypothetical protein HN51_060318 [Arachis hypogaea]
MEDQYNGNEDEGQEKGNVDSEVYDENNNSVKTINVLPTKASQVEGDQTAGHETNEEQYREGKAAVVGELTFEDVGRHGRKRIRKKHARPPSLGITKLGGKTPTEEARGEAESAQEVSSEDVNPYVEPAVEAQGLGTNLASASASTTTVGTTMETSCSTGSAPILAFSVKAPAITIKKSAPPKITRAVAAAPRPMRRGASSARSTVAGTHDLIRVAPLNVAAPSSRATTVRPNAPFRPPQVRPSVAGRPNIPVRPNIPGQVYVPNSSSSALSLVSQQIMNAASKGTTKRFMKFMPTPAPSKPSENPKKKKS